MCLIGAATTASTALAQDLEVVVVTATRRESSVADVPYNISALSDDALSDNRIGEIVDLSRYVAGLSFVDTGPANAGRNNNFTLRGITGDDTANNGGFPTATVAPVSVYIGETPLFLPLQIKDIERVEVLRGPQGTLYGSGSLAGTIRFIPKAPDPSAFSASITVDAGAIASGSDEWNQGLSGFVNVPLGETAALRVAGGYQHWGGFIDLNNLVQFDDPSTALKSPIGIPTAADPDNINSGFVLLPERKDANDADIWHVRTSLLWKPTSSLSATLSHFHQEDEVDGRQAAFAAFPGGVIDHIPAAENPFSPNTAGPIDYPTGGTVFRPSSEYDLPVYRNDTSSRKTDLFGLELNADLGFASLSSSTSYYEDQQDPILDVSAGIAQAFGAFYGFIPRLVDIDYTHNNLEGFTQELRLVSSWDKPIDYVVGAFYQNVKTNDSTIQYIPGQTYFDSISVQFSANPDIGDVNFVTRNKTTFNDRALFGELTWHLTQAWQVTGGVRAFWQDFSVETFSQLPYCGIFCGDNTLGETVVNGDSSVSDQIFKFNTSYRLAERHMAYLTYAEGFRRGGANGIPLSGPFAASPALLLYEPDQTKNYEIGVKGQLWRQNYSLAAYYVDWENLQVNDSAAAGGYDLVANGTQARSQGIELEVSGRITTGLSYSLSYAFIDAEINDSFEVLDTSFGDTVAIISTQKGDPLPNSSRNSGSVSLDYTHDLPWLPGWNLTWHTNGSYRSDANSGLVSLIPGDPQPFTIKAFSVWSASVSLRNDRNVGASLYVDNVFDDRAVTGGVESANVGPRGRYYFVGRPRTVGLQLTYDFGAK